MKHLLTLLFICIASLAMAQPIAKLSSDSAEFSSGTISQEELLELKYVTVTDAKAEEKEYKVESFVVIFHGTGNLKRFTVTGNEIQETLSEINNSPSGPISSGNKLVITGIKIKESQSASETTNLEQGLVLQVL